MHNYFKQYIKAVSQPLPEMADYFEKENSYLNNLVSAESLVLDVGCGNGRTMRFLAPLVKKVVGIDYHEQMIEAARQNLADVQNFELIHGNFFETNLNIKFDLVFASYNLLGSAEIAQNQRQRLLQKMVEITKTGGHVIASVWSDVGIDFANKYYPYIGIKVLKIEGNNVHTDQGTFKRFTKSELKGLADGIGKSFKIVELSNIFYLLDFVV
jgi:SAM-dependent methyltransferase